FVRAFHSLASFRGQSAFYTWLFRITVNVATDRQRARGAQARAFGAERVPEEEWGRTTPDPRGGPDKVAAQAEQRQRIRQALDAWPPKARAIIMLSDVEGLSYREIAEVLRCPIGTVMSRLHNARKRLKSALGSALALLIWLMAAATLWPPAAEAQQVIRFGVRVLEAWNRTSSATSAGVPTPPGSPSPAPPPPQGAPPPPPPGAPRGGTPGLRRPHSEAQPPVPPVAGAVLPPAGSDPDERFRRVLPQLQAIFRFSDFTPIARHVLDGPLGVM